MSRLASAGVRVTGDDCNDQRGDVHPNQTEVCDDRDNNCHGDTDEDVRLTFYVDEDDDGFGSAATVEGSQDGTWSAAANCPTQQCVSPPNGAGNCR